MGWGRFVDSRRRVKGVDNEGTFSTPNAAGSGRGSCASRPDACDGQRIRARAKPDQRLLLVQHVRPARCQRKQLRLSVEVHPGAYREVAAGSDGHAHRSGIRHRVGPGVRHRRAGHLRQLGRLADRWRHPCQEPQYRRGQERHQRRPHDYRDHTPDQRHLCGVELLQRHELGRHGQEPRNQPAAVRCGRRFR